MRLKTIYRFEVIFVNGTWLSHWNSELTLQSVGSGEDKLYLLLIFLGDVVGSAFPDLDQTPQNLIINLLTMLGWITIHKQKCT